MTVDKTLEITYDLASINEKQASELIKANDEVIKKAEQQKTKSKKKTSKKQSKGKDADQQVKDFKKFQKDKERRENAQTKQDQNFKNFIKNNSQGFTSLITNTIKSNPAVGVAIAATAIIISIVKRIDEIQKKFVENVDERINIALSNRDQALVDANLQQIIITNGDGSTNPRNSYNTLNESDANISFTESNYRMENISGFD